MRKYLLTIFFSSLFLISHASALEVLVEAKAAFFRPVGDRFKDIYSKNGIYGAELTVPVWNDFALFGSASYSSASGRSDEEGHKTNVQIIPIGLGVKYFFPQECFDLYVGAGLDFIILRTHDHEKHVIKHISKNGVGGLFKVGLIKDIYEDYFCDLFVEYSLKEFKGDGCHHDKVYGAKANLNSWRLGVGLGYRFGYPYKRSRVFRCS